MDELNKTTFYSRANGVSEGSIVTVFDGLMAPRTIRLDECGKDEIYFGRDPENDIVLHSMLVSAKHGRFVYKNGTWAIEDKGAYEKKGSTNGLVFNNSYIVSKTTVDGDFIRIDDGVEALAEGVLFVFSAGGFGNQWQRYGMQGQSQVTIGREKSCDICLPHVTVSLLHAKISREADGYYIEDCGSTNGLLINNKRVDGQTRLHEKDVIVICNVKLIFTSEALYYCFYNRGIAVDATDIVIRRGKGKKSFVTCNHVSLNIKPGELVSIVGGSGAGKSTVLNCLCGYLKPAEGEVYINGINLYKNFDSLKKLIGYVPQSDIVYDNLTLQDMLRYTAKLRLPEDTSGEEIEAAISRAIGMVELTEKKDSLIKSLSGGQRKRASIAVELLSDPNLIFLDEPASGLDPGTERNLMQSLRKMADAGKTIILVTHSTLQLQLCDKIIYMGKGGNLCYFGPYEQSLRFFGVSDVVDVYNMITDNAPYWRDRFNDTQTRPIRQRKDTTISGGVKVNRRKQLAVLSKRYQKLIVNDKQRLLLLLIQAPLLAVLISFVADGEQFAQYEMTKSLLFALSCSAFWVGMLNAIQEICKERVILKREYMTGLSLSAYLMSKIIVLGILCLIQSIMIVLVFSLLVGLPEEGVVMKPVVELLLTTFVTAVASTAMGLFVSSLFTNADRAMTVAPILLMPQILFSGLIFKLDGATEIISWIAVCRWSMEGYGTSANLNDLPLRLQQEGVVIPHEAESFFDFTAGHFFQSLLILFIFTVLFLFLARVLLKKVKKESS